MLRYDHAKRKMAGVLGRISDEQRRAADARIAAGMAASTEHPSEEELKELRAMFAEQDYEKEIAIAREARRRHLGT